MRQRNPLVAHARYWLTEAHHVALIAPYVYNPRRHRWCRVSTCAIAFRSKAAVKMLTMRVALVQP